MELEDERVTGKPAKVGAEAVLRFAAGTQIPESMEEVVRRYKQVSTAKLDLMAVPADKTILDKIVWPLKSAKVCYCLGQYLACIAASGLVGEMYAILVFEAKAGERSEPTVPTCSDFEKKGQRARIDVLWQNDLIDKKTWTSLKELQGTRRKYLHFLSAHHRQLEADAKKMYVTALRTVKRTVGLKPVTRHSSLCHEEYHG